MTTLPEASGPTRRRFLQLAAASGALAAAAGYVRPVHSTAAAAADPLAHDAVAQTYYRVLLRHTRWAETQWDATAGHYRATDFSFAVVLGNALLLTRGTYDAQVAGVDAATLEAHTLATIEHFAASNRLTGGTEWGKTLFFDTTFQLYFQLAGRLLWDKLDATTRANLDTIAQQQAAYTTSLGSGNDPASSGWTPNGYTGGWVGDTKLEEMGVYAQSIAPGLAWAPGAAGADDWRAAFGRWSRNETGLPAADLANPTVVDGVAVSANTAHNLYDTFIVENHGSYGPHYQCELWRTSARNGIHFLTAGQPLPEVLREQPNSDQLWRSIMDLMSDAGEPLMPMVNDREHLYGRDVIPIAFLAQVLGDRSAAWAETALAARLEAYQAYPPVDRITKFSGEPKYEPEARAEVAISYLLHEWRARTGRPVQPLPADEVFAAAAGARDFGTGPGLVSHQSPNAWAGAITKPGFVKFAWQPQHDDWLFALSGATPMFLPSTGLAVRQRTAHVYERLRDGFDASAVLLGFDAGHAGFATLPGGSIVYVTSGLGAGEGRLTVFNLTMPGVAGLDGSRTYTTAEGAVTVPSSDSGSGTPPPPGITRVDTLTFDAVTTRWVRLLGVTPDPTYGYSIFEFQLRSGSGANLAQGRPTTASSADTGRGAAFATDGDLTTRWAVSRADRPRADSWLAVDLGAPTPVDNISLYWEAAAGRAYRIQVSDDGSTWTDVAHYPNPQVSTTQGWIDVDGRAGLVVRGGANPITVSGDTVSLSDGPVGPWLAEGHPGLDAAGTRAAANRPVPTVDDPSIRASTVEDHLTLFNLSDAAVSTTVSVPQSRTALRLYPGVQTVTGEGTDVEVSLGAADAAVLPPRSVLTAVNARQVPAGTRAQVLDGQRVRLSGPPCVVRVTTPDGGKATTLIGPVAREVRVAQAQPYPLTDLALGRITFPSNPLPPGMSDPVAAVDGNDHTAWTPGPAARMVVDLGSAQPLGRAEVEWFGGRRTAVRVDVSVDGLAYTPAATIAAGQGSARLAATGRYVAFTAVGWRPGWAAVRRFTLLPG
jgi:hypothetical protein